MWIQQHNLQRKVRQQQEYKALLADKIQQKEARSNMLSQRKLHMIEHNQRMNQTLQESFLRTTHATAHAILPQPFETHKKEFNSIKEVKPEVKPED